MSRCAASACATRGSRDRVRGLDWDAPGNATYASKSRDLGDPMLRGGRFEGPTVGDSDAISSPVG